MNWLNARRTRRKGSARTGDELTVSSEDRNVIARYNRTAIAVFDAVLIAFCAYCIWMIVDDVLINRAQLSLMYSFYAFGFLAAMLPASIAMAKLNRIVFVERRPVLWLDGRELVCGNGDLFRENLDDVSIVFKGGLLSPIRLSANGRKPVTLTVAISPSSRDVVRTIELLRSAQLS